MPSAQIKFKVPGSEGLFALSTEYPDKEFLILAAFPHKNGLLVGFEARMSDKSTVIRFFDDSQLSYNILHDEEDIILIQYFVPFVPEPVRATVASGNLLQYPLTLHNGWIVSDLTTSHERLAQLKTEFEDADLTYKVLSVRQSTKSTDLLTTRQRRFMTEAIQNGYYDTPRRCSLTDLAAVLDVGKSTVSRVLHRAEERIIKEFFAEPVE